MGGSFKRKGIYVYLWLIHVEVWQKTTKFYKAIQFSLFSHSVMSDSLWLHGLQHARPACPSLTPGAYSNSCPLSRWYHPTISSSVVPFSSCFQSFSASGSSQMTQLFASGGQNIRVSVATSVRPMNIQDWCPLGCTGWISLQSKELSRVFSINTWLMSSILDSIVLGTYSIKSNKSWYLNQITSVKYQIHKKKQGKHCVIVVC